jgi:P-type E1-E2 ATPase
MIERNYSAMCMTELKITLPSWGATAVEDKLQDNVQDTIQKIKECNITFYILTGDKRETAVNIGRSCGMILPDTEVLVAPE